MDKLNIPGLSSYYGITAGFSKTFQNLMRDIGDAKSKFEEDKIIKKNIQSLKESIDNPNVDSKQMKENLIRLIYCEMLGHDASFGFIHAINFTQKAKIMEKRIGYLACCLLLHKDHELTLLLMNALQKDLQSSNVMENCIGLIAASKLVNTDMIPALLPLVAKLLKHKRDMVRKKAVMVLLRFYHLDPVSVGSMRTKFDETLCDRNPGVMGAALNAYLYHTSGFLKDFKRLTSTFVNILKQVIEFRLPSEFTYYNVPGPWMQIKLMKILANLGNDDHRESEKMYEILKQCIETCYIENNIGCAVFSECLQTIATIYPNKELNALAAKRVGLLLMSNNNNLKYLGIKVLAHLIKLDVSYASRHQMMVIDCLNDPDETVRKKTLVLLCRITNARNVAVICEKLIKYLKSSIDDHLRAELVSQITTLAEKYAPDNEWFIETMNEVFEVSGSLVEPRVAHNLMRIIGEGTDDDELDNELRLHAVDSYLNLIEKPSLPDLLIRIICWVIGEYSYLAEHYDPEDVLERLCSLFTRKYQDNTTKPWIVTAVSKIAGQIGYLPENVKEVMRNEMKTSNDVEMNQRCAELVCVSRVFASLDEILPIDASCEDLEVDSTLSFLDEFVSEALSNGAAPYQSKHLRNTREPKQLIKENKKENGRLNLTPYPTYKKPEKQRPTAKEDIDLKAHVPGIAVSAASVGGTVLPVFKPSRNFTNTKKPVKNIWGPSGYAGHINDTEAKEPKSDSSSTTSGAGSGSHSSDHTSDKYRVQKATPSATHISDDTEKMKLAQQIFNDPSTATMHEGYIRTEKAGFRAKKRIHKSNDTSKPNPDKSQHDSNKEIQSNESLLLDLTDNEFDSTTIAQEDYSSRENLITHPIQTPEFHGPDEITALDPVIPENLIVPENEAVTESEEIQTGSLSVSELSLQENLTSFHEMKTDNVNLLDQDNEEVDSFTAETNATSLAERSCPTIPQELDGHHASPIATICEDQNIRFSFQRVSCPDSHVLVMFLTNQRPTPLRDVSIILQPPSNLSAFVDDKPDLNIRCEIIDGFNIKTSVVTMKFKSPSLHMILGGQISYTDLNGSGTRLFINHQLSIFEFMRPMDINTDTYARKWVSTAYEKRQQITNVQRQPLQDVIHLVEEEFNFQIVQVIGTEVIAAGTILGRDECLLHFKYSPSSTEFRLKTGSKLLNDCIMNGIIKTLAK